MSSSPPPSPGDSPNGPGGRRSTPPGPEHAPEKASEPGGRGEDEVVRAIVDRLVEASGPVPDGELWEGDDAAAVRLEGVPVILTADAVVAGVHADLALTSLADFGWRAITAAVSDVAALGAIPRYCLVTYCLPPGTDVDQLTRGIAEAARQYHAPVIGGDVTSAGELSVSVSAVGTLPPEARRPVTRAGANAGDRLLVTGPCGASAAGLRLLREAASGPRPSNGPASLALSHRRPLARLEEGRAANAAGVTAMIDVSDGLSRDIDRLAVASGVGVHLATVPVAVGATETEALAGGEDFELVMATPEAELLIQAFEQRGLRPPIDIGRCVDPPHERRLRDGPLRVQGWQHEL